MKEQNNIEEVFKKAFDGFEADPGSNAWANIQSGIQSGAASATVAAKAGLSVVTKTIIGVAIGTAAAVAGYYVLNTEEVKSAEKNVFVEDQATDVDASANDFEPTSNETPTELETDLIQDQKTDKVEIENKIEGKEIAPLVEDQPSNSTVDQIIDTVKNLVRNMVDVQQSNDEVHVKEEVANKIQPSPVEEKSSLALETAPDATIRQEYNQFETANSNEQVLNENQSRKAPNLFIPNIITPNRDGKSDVIELKEQEIEDFNIDLIHTAIYNVSGKLVHQQENRSPILWDGYLSNGEVAPQGQYYYVIIVTIEGEKKLPIRSSFTLRW